MLWDITEEQIKRVSDDVKRFTLVAEGSSEVAVLAAADVISPRAQLVCTITEADLQKENLDFDEDKDVELYVATLLKRQHNVQGHVELRWDA